MANCYKFILVISLLGFYSCQKKSTGLVVPNNNDTSSEAKPGQLIGLKVYQGSPGNAIPVYYYEFKYKSNPKRLIEFRHQGDIFTRQFVLDNDSANKIWTYDNNGLLIEQSGFYKNVNNITYTNRFHRGPSGELISFEYLNSYGTYACATSQNAWHKENALAYFSTRIQNGGKVIDFIDTLSKADQSGNLECNYSVFFDAVGKIQARVSNGIMLNDEQACFHINYFPIQDTIRQFFYDPGTGRLQKTIYTYYSGGTGPIPINVERQLVSASFTYASQDNHKISDFFNEYTWGRDLQFWFNYRQQFDGDVVCGTDADYFSPNGEHLKSGICDNVVITIEDINQGISQGINEIKYDTRKVYDSNGNLLHYELVGATNDWYYEFLYK